MRPPRALSSWPLCKLYSYTKPHDAARELARVERDRRRIYAYIASLGYLVSVLSTSLSRIRATPALRSAASLIRICAAVPITWAASDGLSA